MSWFSCCVGARDQAQAGRLGRKHLDPLGHPALLSCPFFSVSATCSAYATAQNAYPQTYVAQLVLVPQDSTLLGPFFLESLPWPS